MSSVNALTLKAKTVATSKVARHFWVILVGVMVAAITASAIAVWLTATPFLRNFQHDAVVQKAEQRAINLETILDQHRQILAFIASQKSIIATAMGYVENVDVLSDFTIDAQLPDHLMWIGLYDAFGRPLAKQDIGPESAAVFTQAEISAFARTITEEQPDAKKVVLLRQTDHFVTMLMAAPVLNHQFTEGVLIGQLHLRAHEVFPADHSVRSIDIQSLDTPQTVGSQNQADVTVATVPGTRLLVSVEANAAVITAGGRELLINTTSAITLVLALAFGIFAWLGRTSIIAPHHALEKQKRDLSELAAVAKLANDAIIVTDLDEKILWCNPAFQKLTGYGINEICGRRPSDFLHGDGTDPAWRFEMRESFKNNAGKNIEILNYAKNGRAYWVSLSITALTDENGETYGYMALSNDISEARRQREALIQSKNETEFQSLHDPLTELANRRAFDAELENRRKMGVADGTIIHFDLDHFKNVNDNMGHAAGDFVLCEIANILRHEVRGGTDDRMPDLAVRMGGDEFVILLSPSTTVATAEKLSARLLQKMRKPMIFGTSTLQVGASFGIASTLEGLLEFDELLAAADASLYVAKKRGRNMIHCYTETLHLEVIEQRLLAREFKDAIANQTFEPFFQPQFDAITGEISGAEVLARWPNQRRGLLTPDVFLPMAEQLSLMLELDQILFQKASDQIMALHEKGMRIPKISFNVTAERLRDGAVFEGISGLGPDRPDIAIEVLESVIVEEQSEDFLLEIDRLRAVGVMIEIDDFGSGHTSLVGVMELNPDVMKIDKRLIIPITSSEQARNMLTQIVGMAKIIGLKITAEGVETMAHADIATAAGCDTLQGFGLARPMPVEELEALMNGIQHQDPRALSA